MAAKPVYVGRCRSAAIDCRSLKRLPPSQKSRIAISYYSNTAMHSESAIRLFQRSKIQNLATELRHPWLNFYHLMSCDPNFVGNRVRGNCYSSESLTRSQLSGRYLPGIALDVVLSALQSQIIVPSSCALAINQ